MKERYFTNRINVYLTDEQKNKLISIAEVESATLSATIRNLMIKGMKYYGEN